MSQKANPTTIGLFIVIGVALGVVGLILFSSGKLFSTKQRFILYFDASLKGLNPGAPVKLRGVTVGSVSDVLITHNQAREDFAMPVIIEIDEKLVQARSDRLLRLGDREHFDDLVRRGLRGKLDADSLLTGVLYVELAIAPNAPPPVFHQLTPEYPEIPTLPTSIQELMANLASFDIKGISEKLNVLLDRLDSSFNELDLGRLSTGLSDLITSMDRVVNSPDLTNSLAELRLTLVDTRALVRNLDRQVDPLASGVTNTLELVQQTLAELRRSAEQFNGLLAPDAPLPQDLTGALSDLGSAARAITELSEFLQRNPNALISGKKILPLKR